MTTISLSAQDLGLAALLVLAVALLSSRLELGVGRRMLIAAARTTAQLLLVGLVLKSLFAHAELHWVALLACVMLLVAGREVLARQQRRFVGAWGYGIGTTSMLLSSFAVTILALTVVIGPTPWYTPQYAIPLLGMLLGNTMNGVSLGLDRLTHQVWQERASVEGRLLLGQSRHEALRSVRRDAMRSGLMPIINAMSVAGVVSLPGMMTGQILAGAPPVEAVKYQVLIMFLIAGGTGLGTAGAVWLGSQRLFDERDRLRLERLSAPKPS